jgi:hypothetical protein
MEDPPGSTDTNILDKIQGSLIGLALGDALGAHVEFRPRSYLIEHPVTDLEGGGTWGLRKGQVLYLHCVLSERKLELGSVKFLSQNDCVIDLVEPETVRLNFSLLTIIIIELLGDLIDLV